MIHNAPNADQEAIAHKISNFYLQKNANDYAKAKEEIEKLRIFDIRLNGENVEIYLGRPGLIIGKKGTNIDNLTAFLGEPVKIFKSFHWNDILVPTEYDPADFE